MSKKPIQKRAPKNKSGDIEDFHLPDLDTPINKRKKKATPKAKIQQQPENKVMSPKIVIQKQKLPAPKYINPYDKNLSVKLSSDQKKAIHHMDGNDSLGIFLPAGSGKTLISVIIANNYLSKYPNHTVICISPAGLIDNFEKEAVSHNIMKVDNRFHFYSYEKYLSMTKKGKGLICNNTLLILDEAHQLRNAKSLKYEAIMSCVVRCHKVVALTASPYVNYIKDFIPLINILYKSYIVGPTITETKYKMPYSSLRTMSIYSDTEKIKAQLTFVSKFLDQKVIFAEQDLSDPNYPTFDIKTRKIPMKKEYENDFMKAMEEKSIFTNPESFYNGYRRAVNKVSEDYYSRKLGYISKYLQKSQSIIYTNWLEYGVKCITTILDEKNIKYGIIDGSVSASERTKITRAYNSKKLQTLVYTKAGSEGIDLKNTEYVFFLEPVWSYALLDQTMKRAIRYESHKNSKNKHVHVVLLCLTSTNPDAKSGDVLLYDIIKKKKAIQLRLNPILKKCSI